MASLRSSFDCDIILRARNSAECFNRFAMKFLILNGKSRRQPCGARNEFGMISLGLLNPLAFKLLSMRHRRELDHFVIADAGGLTMPEGANTSPRPRMRLIQIPKVPTYCVVDAIDQIGLSVPAVSTNFRDELSCERNIRHRRPLPFRVCGQLFHDAVFLCP